VDRALNRNGEALLHLGVDREFGPFFIQFCTYFPFNAKFQVNGHEYAKRQVSRKGIAFEALATARRQRASGLRFADPRVHSLWQATILFRQLAEGFRAADLRRHLAGLPGTKKISQGRDQLSIATFAFAWVYRAPAAPIDISYRVTELCFRAGLFCTPIYNRLQRNKPLCGHSVSRRAE
jgi:hypothetical protein